MRTVALKLGRLVFVVVRGHVPVLLDAASSRSARATSSRICAVRAARGEGPTARGHRAEQAASSCSTRTGSTNFVQGDFGKTYTGLGENVTGVPVSDGLWKRLPVSLELMIYAQVLALLIAIPMGVLTAYRNGTLFDRISNIAGVRPAGDAGVRRSRCC